MLLFKTQKFQKYRLPEANACVIPSGLASIIEEPENRDTNKIKANML